jgi:hypothetical protein
MIWARAGERVDRGRGSGTRRKEIVDWHEAYLLFIVIDIGDDLVTRTVGEIHRAHDLLNKSDLTFGEPISLIEILVRPFFCPFLGRNEGVNLSSCALSRLVQQNDALSGFQGRNHTASAPNR